MPLIMCECALHRFHHRPPNWILMIKVIFKFISALKEWLVCTIFSAIILLHVRTHSSKNYSPIFLRVFTPTFLNTLPANTPRMKNPFIQWLHLFLHSTLMIRPTFLRYFVSYFCTFFLCNLKIFTTRTVSQDIQKGRRPRTTDDLQEGPEALYYPKLARVGEYLQLLPPFLGSPGRKQLEPLPTVKTSQLNVPH